ncbi:hypothetical protein QRD87_02690 [Bacillus altitudinis]|uniref:hypothetical protein n=1 Tax=Bacillus altitudinis TaxID=293387 RepID=UPI0015876413|nr:hypothetical protein [Bacillus altitudinis]WJE30823.1 hypothetical protein QRD87_02690 [Bacillus altitudinis]
MRKGQQFQHDSKEFKMNAVKMYEEENRLFKGTGRILKKRYQNLHGEDGFKRM